MGRAQAGGEVIIFEHSGQKPDTTASDPNSQFMNLEEILVGARGLKPPASWSRTRRSLYLKCLQDSPQLASKHSCPPTCGDAGNHFCPPTFWNSAKLVITNLTTHTASLRNALNRTELCESPFRAEMSRIPVRSCPQLKPTVSYKLDRAFQSRSPFALRGIDRSTHRLPILICLTILTRAIVPFPISRNGGRREKLVGEASVDSKAASKLAK